MAAQASLFLLDFLFRLFSGRFYGLSFVLFFFISLGENNVVNWNSKKDHPCWMPNPFKETENQEQDGYCHGIRKDVRIARLYRDNKRLHYRNKQEQQPCGMPCAVNRSNEHKRNKNHNRESDDNRPFNTRFFIFFFAVYKYP